MFFLQKLPVNGFNFFHGAGQRKLFCISGVTAAGFGPFLRMFNPPVDFFRQILRISGLEQRAAVQRKIPGGAGTRIGNQRYQTGGESFHAGERFDFDFGCVHIQIAAGHAFQKFRIRPETEEHRRIRQFFPHPPVFFAQRPAAGKPQMNRIPVFGKADGFQQHILPFFRRKAAGHQDMETFMRYRRLVRKIRRNSVADDMEGSPETVIRKLVGNKLRRTVDMGKAPEKIPVKKTVKQPGSQAAFPQPDKVRDILRLQVVGCKTRDPHFFRFFRNGFFHRERQVQVHHVHTLQRRTDHLFYRLRKYNALFFRNRRHQRNVLPRQHEFIRARTAGTDYTDRVPAQTQLFRKAPGGDRRPVGRIVKLVHCQKDCHAHVISQIPRIDNKNAVISVKSGFCWCNYTNKSRAPLPSAEFPENPGVCRAILTLDELPELADTEGMFNFSKPEIDPKYQAGLEKQHKRGKLHAIERIQALLDPGSFTEIYSGVRHNCTEFGMEGKDIPYDGVITGFGTINGRQVAVYSQDFTLQGGSLGFLHGQKIANIIEAAVNARCPLIGINDSGGARIQEGVNALAGYGDIFYNNVRASGYIPQISIIAGSCAGGAVYSPGITDFVFTVKSISLLFVTGAKVVKAACNIDITDEALGGADVHARKSGVAHFFAETEQECFASVRRLLDFIPHYYGDNTGKDAEGRRNPAFKFNKAKRKAIGEVLPEKQSQCYDVHRIIDCLADDGGFLEVHAGFAQNVVVGFTHIAGRVTGIVANQSACLGGVLDCDASDKAARFIRYCDAFDIPLLTLADVPGFLPGPQEEQKGIIRHGAKLIYAYAEATVPKVTVILRKAYGGAYIAMCSRHLKADFVFAWESSEIAVMGADGAVQILFGKELKNGSVSLEEKKEEYRRSFMNPWTAARAGNISEVIRPEDTRDKITAAFDFLQAKKQMSGVKKKHGNIPL